MVRNMIEGLRFGFVGSLQFESDPAFRAQMGRLVKRDVFQGGVLGLLVLGVFVFAQIVILDRAPVLQYGTPDPSTVTVLWDKLAMAIVFGSLLVVHPLLPENRPSIGRLAITAASIIVVVAMALDDVASHNVEFSPAYVTLVLLFLVGAVPMRPPVVLVAIVVLIACWFCSIRYLPGLFDLQNGTVHKSHIVFLGIVGILATAITAILYTVRFEEFRARRSAERLSEELSESNEILEKALIDLGAAQDRLVYAEKMASLGRFATGLAHEMRNPLNFVTNFSKLSADLVDENDGVMEADDIEDLRANLHRIQEHAARAEGIVKSFITHTQMRSNHPSDVNLNQLLREQTAVLERRYSPDDAARGVVKLSLQLDPNVGSLKAYPSDLIHAFDHILDNAFRATMDRAAAEESGYEPEVVVSTESHSEGVRIVVSDNGVGMSESDLTMVFEPFFTTRATGDGTGLGLSSAYSTITERHGGQISVHSDLGQGSRFTVDLQNVVVDDGGEATE